MRETAQTSDSTAAPIFVHSLYRSGSTWIFDRFRHATVPYWCYQEPYHEATIWLQTRPDDLLGFDHRAATALRHPALDRPYFAEVHALREQVAPLFQKCISFDSFFDTSSCPAFHAYTRALIDFAPQRPMLQCCRSFGRVRQIRSEHGGIHIHLWREPREQWWSYQINDYFDTTSLLILQADTLPPPLQLVADRIGLRHERRSSHDEDYTSLLRFPIDAAGRYLAFYALWMYSQLSNFELADCNISIDALAADPAELAVCMDRFQQLGIEGVDLSECKVPHSQFNSADEAFFDPIEREARQFFQDGGWASEAIERVVERQRTASALGKASQAAMLDDGTRGRSAALRYADHVKAARLSEHAALHQKDLLTTEVDSLRASLGREQQEFEATRTDLDAERSLRVAFEQRAMQAEQRKEELAQATESHLALVQTHVQLAQQQIELTQTHSREVRLEADRLGGEIHAARDHLGALVERFAADSLARTDGIINRVEALDAKQAVAAEALFTRLAEQLASLSTHHHESLQAQRSAWREDIAGHISSAQMDLREAIALSSADSIARTDSLIGKVEALASGQADAHAAWALALERQGQASAQALREISAQLSSLTLALQSRDARIEELERQAAAAGETLNTLRGFRDAILGTRTGRWLAARKGMGATAPLPPSSASD